MALCSEGKALILDAGFPLKEVRRRLDDAGVGLSEIAGVLITHEHTDHARGIGKFLYHGRAPVAANAGTAAALRSTFGVDGVQPLANGEQVTFGGFLVRPIAVPHDSADCAGYEIEFGERRLLYATDLGAVPEALVEAGRRSDIAVLESNHDRDMLWGGTYPQFLKERIAGGRGHLSNEQAAQAVAKMAGGRLRKVVLAHLSQENNRPEAAVLAVKGALRAGAGLEAFSVSVEAAPKDGPAVVAIH